MTNYERLCVLLCGDPATAIGPTAYTPSGVAQWKRAGRYGKTPSEGAFVYFYSTNLGRVSHVELVVSAYLQNGLYHMETIGGNTGAGKNETEFRDGGKCIQKTYEFLPSQVGGANRINGFGYPKFGAETCSAQQLIEEAKRWLGYLEKEHSWSDLWDKLADPGDNNCTIFGKWYGDTVGDPKTYTCAQWCSMFCCFCAKEAVVKAHEDPTGWVKTEAGWTYQKAGGGLCRDEWLHYGGRWYVFNAAGIMITGWFRSKEGWYYLAGDGAMCSSQWIQENGKSYYVTGTGLMAVNCYVKSKTPGPAVYYWVGEDGVWLPEWDTMTPDLKKYYVAI